MGTNKKLKPKRVVGYRVLKYTIPLNRENRTITVSENYEVLSSHNHHGNLVVYIKEGVGKDKCTELTFYVLETGEAFANDNLTFVDTVTFSVGGGDYVLHVFFEDTTAYEDIEDDDWDSDEEDLFEDDDDELIEVEVDLSKLTNVKVKLSHLGKQYLYASMAGLKRKKPKADKEGYYEISLDRFIVMRSRALVDGYLQRDIFEEQKIIFTNY